MAPELVREGGLAKHAPTARPYLVHTVALNLDGQPLGPHKGTLPMRQSAWILRGGVWPGTEFGHRTNLVSMRVLLLLAQLFKNKTKKDAHHRPVDVRASGP